MDALTLGSLLIGLVIRLGIPLSVSILLFRWLSRLDARWQEDAKRDAGQGPAKPGVKNNGCWDVWHCTKVQKAECPAFARQETPCWQVFRQKDGKLKEKCFGCSVFRTAPLPVQ